MGKKSRLKKRRRQEFNDSGLPIWASDEGVHALGVGQPPSASDLESMTAAYQDQIRKSELWAQMVKEFGEQKATEMLKQFTVQIDAGA
jgi:hypothetical protein